MSHYPAASSRVSHESYGSHSSRKTARFADSPPFTSSRGSLPSTGSHSSQSHSSNTRYSHRSSRSRASAPKPAQYHESFSTSKRDHFHPPATYTVMTPNAKYYVTLPPRPDPTDAKTKGAGRSASVNVNTPRGREHTRAHRSASVSQTQQPRARSSSRPSTGTGMRPQHVNDESTRHRRNGVVMFAAPKVSFADKIRRLFGLPPKGPSPNKSKRSSSTSRGVRTQPLARRGTR